MKKKRILIFAFILLFSFAETAYLQDVSTVITQGIGKDVESATQRAAARKFGGS